MSSHPRMKLRLNDEKPSLSTMVMDDNFCDIYIQNIPIDITREGLQNIFVKAGPIEKVKLLTNKNDGLSLYGFVTYRNKSSALSAVNMFHDFKVGPNKIRVKLAKPKEQSSNKQQASTPQTQSSINGDFDDDWDEPKPINTKSQTEAALESTLNDSINSNTSRCMGRGRVQSEIRQRSQFDLSRPYARRLASRRASVTSGSAISLQQQTNVKEGLSRTSLKSSELSVNEVFIKEKPSRKLKKGDSLRVDLVYIDNPSLFYVQPYETLEKLGDLMSNIDNCYRNEDEDTADKMIDNLKVGDQCACQIDRYWQRCKIISKNDLNTYGVQTIDFGENFEIQKEFVRRLKKEFENIECTRMRCALAGIKPYKSNEWSIDAIEMLQNLSQKLKKQNSQDPLFARIIDTYCDNDGEEIFIIELYVKDHLNCVISLMIDMKLAEKITASNSQTHNFYNDIPSVSQQNLQTPEDIIFEPSRVNSSNSSSARILNTTHNRNKLFNVGFPIFKKRFMTERRPHAPATELNVFLTAFENIKSFYVTSNEDLDRREKLDLVIQRYAMELIKNTDIHEALYQFMVSSVQFDMVLAWCNNEQKWKRACIIEKIHMASTDWFNVKYIDDGRSQYIECTTYLYDLKDVPVLNVLTILPFSSTLTTIPPFTIHCSIHRTESIEEVYKRALNRKEYELNEDRLHEAFRDNFLNKNLIMTVTNYTILNKECDHNVELYFEDENGNLSNCFDFITNYLRDNEDKISSDPLDRVCKTIIDKSKLNSKTSQKKPLEESSKSSSVSIDKQSQKSIERAYSNEPVKQSTLSNSISSLNRQLEPSIISSKAQIKQSPKIEVSSDNIEFLKENQEYNVYLMNLIDFRNLFVVQTAKNNDVITILEEINLEEFIDHQTKSILSTDELLNGELVVVYYDDNYYCRAIIIDTQLVLNKIKVFFVDYGNLEYVEIKNIRKIIGGESIKKEAFKINYCELDLSEEINEELNINKQVANTVNDKLNSLLEQELKIKVIQVNKNKLMHSIELKDSKNLVLENHMPKYSIKIYLDNDNDESFMKLIGLDKIQSKSFKVAKTYTLKEVTQRMVTLESGKIYHVNLQFADQDTYFIYLALTENYNQINEIQEYLQKDHITSKVKYLTSIDTNYLYKQIEALFKDDLQWYRAVVTNVTSHYVEVLFADFGNTEIFEVNDIKMGKILRERIFIDDVPDKVYNTFYQAIKCSFKDRPNKKLVQEFYSTFETTADYVENGFKIKVIKSIEDGESMYHLFDFYSGDVFADYDDNSDLGLEISSLGIKLSPNNLKYKCSIIQLNSINDFYIQLDDNMEKLTKNQDALQILMKSISMPQKFILKNTDYIVFKNPSDTLWNRGIIVGQSDRKYDVYSVDYGFNEQVDAEFIVPVRVLSHLAKKSVIKTEEYEAIFKNSFQAILCRLNDDVFKDDENNTQTLISIVEKYLSIDMMVHDTSSFILDLYKHHIELFVNDESLNDQFEKKKIIISQKELNIGQNYRMKISVCESADELFLQLVDDFEKIDQIEQHLNDPTTCSQLKKFTITPTKGDIVVSKYKALDLCYRARILNSKNSKFDIFYIDYGNCETNIDLENLRQLDTSDLCTKTSQLAYSMKLNNVDYDASNPEHKSLLDTLIEMDQLNVKIISSTCKQDQLSNTYEVQLFDPRDENICFNDYFSLKIDSLDLSFLQIGKTFDAEYSFIDLFDSPFYFHLEYTFEQLTSLQIELDSYYINKANIQTTKNVNIGDYFAYYYDNEWCRVQVTDVSNNKIKIFFIDYGNVHEISVKESSDLKCLSNKFKRQPRLAYPVRLCDPFEPTKEIYDYLSMDECLTKIQEFCFDNENNKITFKLKIHSTNPCLVEILDDENKSLNELLKKPKLVFKQLKYSDLPKQEDINEDKQVYRIYMNKFDDFYLWNEEKIMIIQDEVVKIIESIQDFEKNTLKSFLKVNIRPEIGDLVFCQSTDDECWYRSLITNISDDYKLFEIFFIDFGNYLNVSSEFVVLPSDDLHLNVFKNYPPQAYKSKLYGLVPPFSDKCRDFFKEIVIDGEFYAKTIKKNDLKTNEMGNIFPLYEIRLIKADNLLDIHKNLVENKMAKFDSLENILLAKKTDKEVQFYTNIINITNRL